MSQLPPALYRTIVVVDVEGFTSPGRSLSDRLALREGMYDLLKIAFGESGVDFGSCASEDRGDGALILLPIGISKTVVADQLPERIAVALRRYNVTRVPEAQMRLRVSVNSGDVVHDGNGWVGQAIDIAFRVVEAPPVKTAFAVSDRLVAFISPPGFYDEVIKLDSGLLPDSYTAVPISVKTFTETVYFRLLGEPVRPKPQTSVALSPPPEKAVSAEVGDDLVLELIPPSGLAELRRQLTRMDVPRLSVLVSRALGPAVPLPSLAGITDAWDAFELLTDFNAGPDGIPPAISFLRLLAAGTGGAPAAAVNDWIDDQAHRLRLGPALAEQRRTQPPLTESSRLHLMIMVEPVSADPGRCTLAFWRQDDPDVWPPPLGGIREVGIDEVEYRVDELILETEDVWSDQRIAAAVEFLLPRTLINLPIQRWAKEHATGQPEPLRYGYRLGIRSLERMRSKHWHRAWNVRWNSMLEDPSAERLHYSGCPEFEEFPIDAILSDERWIGLVMAKPPAPEPDALPDELTTALRGGLPVILWHPEAGPENLRELLDWLLDEESGFIGLPERRKLANSRAALPFEHSLVEDLVVLWDDPKRVIVLGQPLLPNRQ
ncbi:hypothetical protein [Amycolatopsis sp. 195334CR]|uniref:VMAP-C domain-containing protein n=1 Tax=Amycolatopsis sp. 195334CR TaxID=2814588 RepID=UPI001A8DC956|nr:hypothetical protein [Amycolatopsis sp. 195334CR]MBN6041082.1 hypothetical protein [Amycolatopsis sp. 195334CR]